MAKDSISGSDSGSPLGTSYVSDAKTAQKIEILRKKNPSLADYAANLFGVSNISSVSKDKAKTVSEAKELDRHSRNVLQTLFSAELTAHGNSGGGKTGSAKTNAQGGDTRGIKDSVHEILKPVSSAIGSTLGTLTNILHDPLGAPEMIGKSLGHTLDKVNPGFMDKLNATFKKYKVDELGHLPTQIFGGLKSLASKLDKLLSYPLSLASDIYSGLMKIIGKISKMLDSAVSAVFDFIFGPNGMLDSILPVSQIMSFLSAIGELSSMFGSIAGGFSGLTAVTSSVSQLNGFASQAQGMLSNPMQLASSYMPKSAMQGMSFIRNPQQMMSKLVPAGIQKQLGSIGSLPGLGMVGNLGYGTGGGLQEISGGVISSLMGKYSKQLNIVAPLLGQQSSGKPIFSPKSSFPPSINPSPVNSSIATVRNFPVDLQPKPIVLPTKTT
jgi:hypothetical protein